MFVVGSSSYGTPMQYKYKYMNRLAVPLPEMLDEKPDLIVFTGGEDINPAMYGEKSIYRGSHYNNERDANEKAWYLYAKTNKIPMVGICRGMQLFTIMQGGKLIQDIVGHSGRAAHKITTIDKNIVNTNSLHHQVCVPYKSSGSPINHVMLAWSDEWEHYSGTKETELLFAEMGRIPEAIWFPDINALGVQFHPEMMQRDSSGYKYFTSLLETYLP